MTFGPKNGPPVCAMIKKTLVEEATHLSEQWHPEHAKQVSVKQIVNDSLIWFNDG